MLEKIKQLGHTSLLARLKCLSTCRWVFILVLICLVSIIYVLKFANHYPVERDLSSQADSFGITFSTKFADELDLDWKETYDAIINELGVKYIRIPVYWDEIEATEDVYDFTKYDYIISEGSKHNIKFVISVGRRIPRWPECHSPSWLNQKREIAAKVLMLKTIRTIVERYRDEDSVEYWQVENEPFFDNFGVCPPLDQDFLKQEFNWVRSLDSRPVIITGSGEMSLWQREIKIGDIFGVSLYRVVYNSWFGYIRYPFSKSMYKLKAKLTGLPADKIMIMELQAEPWVPQGKMIHLSTDEINKTMSLRQFQANLQYAIDLNFSRTYTWGAEWWYWQKKYGNPGYWRIAEEIFK